jgi:hypothetical protein
MERVAPPPLPSVLPKVDVRVLMSDHAEGLFAELEHFVMLAGTVCVQHGIPVGWEELVAFRRTVAGQINDLLDQFGPLRDDHHHTVVDISDTAELLESMRPPKR